MSDETRAPDGWQGTPPAEGTRRKLILDTIHAVNPDLLEGPEQELALADSIEEALLRVVDNGASPESGSPASVAMDLLDSFDVPRTRDGAILTISERLTVFADRFTEAHRELREAREDVAGLEEGLEVKEQTIKGLASTVDHQATVLDQLRFIAPEGKVPTDTSEIHVVLADNDADSPQMLFVELENQHGHGPGGFERQKIGDLTHIVIPYGRHDGWVASLVHRVAGAVVAGEPTGIACRRLLAEVGVRTLCRKHSEEELAKGVRGAERREDDSPGGDDPAATIKFLEGEVERLLGRREEARSSEARFAEERDCAFALLRWLLPVTVAKRID